MINLERITPSASTRRGIERWIRSIAPRSARRSSPVTRLIAGLGLALAGATAALLLSPKTGREMRAITRKRFDALQRSARALKIKGRAARPLKNGRAAETVSERARRA